MAFSPPERPPSRSVSHSLDRRDRSNSGGASTSSPFSSKDGASLAPAALEEGSSKRQWSIDVVIKPLSEEERRSLEVVKRNEKRGKAADRALRILGEGEEGACRILRQLGIGDDGCPEYLVQLERDGKRVKRSESEVRRLAPALLASYKLARELNFTANTPDDNEDSSSSKRETSILTARDKGKGKAVDEVTQNKSRKSFQELVLEDSSDEDDDKSRRSRMSFKQDMRSTQSEGEEEEDEEGESTSASEQDDENEDEDNSDSSRQKPSRQSTRSNRHTKSYALDGFEVASSPGNIYDGVKPNARRSARSSESKSTTHIDTESSEDELLLRPGGSRRESRSRSGRTSTRETTEEGGGRQVRELRDRNEKGKGKGKIVEIDDDGGEEDEERREDDAEFDELDEKVLIQHQHRDVCFKCSQGPTDGILEKLYKRKSNRRKTGAKRRRNADDFGVDTDGEIELTQKLGAWMECGVCLISAHFGCLPEHVRKEFVRNLKADHEVLHAPPPPSPPLVDVDATTLPPPPPAPAVTIPKREKIELDSTRTFTVPKCASCIKAGGRRCFMCGVNGKLATGTPGNKEDATVAGSSSDAVEKDDPASMDVDDSDAIVIKPDAPKASDPAAPVDGDPSPDSAPPLMFRCVKCKRVAHYDCLPRNDDNDDMPFDQHVQSYFEEGQCHECWSYRIPLDVILAWQEDDWADEEGAGSKDDEDAVVGPAAVVKKDEKTGKLFTLPSAKDPTCNAKYLVKWQERSYRHLEWVSHAFLAAVYPAKLTNFLAKGSTVSFQSPAEAEIDDDIDEDRQAVVGTSPLSDPEAEARIPPAWSTVDRVLNVWYLNKKGYLVPCDNFTPPNEDPMESIKLVGQCYFKWGDLPYSASTIEEPPAPDEEGYDAFVKAYKAFLTASRPSMRVPQLTKSQMAELNKTRDDRQFHPIEKQPDHIVNGNLMPFQIEGVNFLFFQWWKRQGCILADEMGLGKTVQIITLLSVLNKNQGARPFLVAVPNSTIGNWVREFERWAPQLRVVPYGGDQVSRKIVEDYELFDGQGFLKAHVVLGTYEALEKNIKVFRKVARWDCLVVDEGQRLKSGPGGLLYDALCSLNINHRILLSGTPLNNNITELFALLHFIDPAKWGNLDELTEQYADLTPQKVDEIRRILKPYFLRRTKELVLQLPPLTEMVVPVTMTVLQRKLYRNLLEKNVQVIMSIFQKTNDKQAKVNKASFNNLLMQLRKVLGHPYLVSRDIERLDVNRVQAYQNLKDASAKLVLLDKLLPKLKADGHRVLIFSQFKIVLDILEDFLDGLQLKYLRLDGDTATLDRQRGIDAYQREGSEYFAYILSTRAGGVGINLTTADTVIMYDQDFNPQQDLQAIARAHRIGQKKNVAVYKLLTKGTCEEKILKSGQKKLGLDHIIIRLMGDDEGEGDVESILQYGAKEIFSDEAAEKDAINYTDAAIDKLIADTQQPAAGPSKEKSAAASFAFAKVWENERDDSGGIQVEEAGKGDENLHDFWANILAEQERKDKAAKAAAAADGGRGKRKRAEVKYAPESPIKLAGSKKRKGSSGPSSDDEHAYDEYRESGARSESDASDGFTGVVDKAELQDMAEDQLPPKKRKKGLLAEGKSSTANGDRGSPSSDDQRIAQRANRIAIRRQNIDVIADGCKHWNEPYLQQVLRAAREADFDTQTAYIRAATHLIGQISRNANGGSVAPRPAAINGAGPSNGVAYSPAI